MELNRKLVEQVRDRLIAHPYQYDQARWGHIFIDIAPRDVSAFMDITDDELVEFVCLGDECGTPGCILGHSFDIAGVRMEYGDMRSDIIWRDGAELWGITMRQARTLFERWWPERWSRHNEAGPLSLRSEDIFRSGNMFIPDSCDAIHVLNNLLRYGFEKE